MKFVALYDKPCSSVHPTCLLHRGWHDGGLGVPRLGMESGAMVWISSAGHTSPRLPHEWWYQVSALRHRGCHDFRALIIAVHSPGNTMGRDVTSRRSQKRRMSVGTGTEDPRTLKRPRVVSPDGDRPQNRNNTNSRPTKLGGYPSRLSRQPVSLHCSVSGPY